MNDVRREKEEAILGAILLEKGAYLKVCDFLAPINFKQPGYAEIYKAASELFPSKPIDIVTVNHQLGGNHSYVLSYLTSKVSSAANISYHARVLLELSIREAFICLLSKSKSHHSVTVFSAIQDLIDAVNNHTNDILLVIDKAIPYLDGINAPDVLIERVKNFQQQFAYKIKKIREQSASNELFNQLQSIGQVPQNDYAREATQKLIELLKLALAFGLDNDKELCIKIINLYDQRTQRL